MQKKSNQPSRPTPQKAGGNIGRPPPASPPQFIKKAPPPRQMVTATERQQKKEERRSIPAIRTPSAGSAVPAAAGAASAADALQAEVQRFNNLQSSLVLTEINDDLEDIDSAVNALPANIENIRARGYVFKSYLETKAQTLINQWQELRPRVQQGIQSQTRSLQADAASVGNILRRNALAGAALTTLESKVGAAVNNLRGMYDTLDDNVNQTQQQIDDISWTLQQAEQASFGFLPTECPVEAVPANWKKADDKDGVEGVLFLTDQRLMFEQKEEVATKKVLFITTEKQKLQALQWVVPVAQIEKALGAKKGFMNKDDYLTVTSGGAFTGANGEPLYVPGTGGAIRTVELHLKGESGEAWQGFIGRVKSGEVAKERTVPVDEVAVEAVANAPTKCSNCGATFSQTILRGQTEIKCEFCGSITRL